MVCIIAQRELEHRLRSELQHVLIHVPRLVVFIQLVEYLERIFDTSLHRGRVVPNRFWRHCWWDELMSCAPGVCVCIVDEQSAIVLNFSQGMFWRDLLAEECRFLEGHSCN